MIRRAWQASCKRIGSGLLLGGVLVGLPILLGHIGSPLPARVPSWSRFVTDLRVGYVPSSAACKVALGAGWAMWAFLTYEIVAETSSWMRNHASRRSSALGPLQPLLANAIAALVLSAPFPGRSLVATASAPVTTTIELSSELMAAAPLPPLVAVPPIPLAGDPTSFPTYVVQPHDTLWGIAERYLGNPLRWSEIASLNEGRPEGGSKFGDPNWIYPGWTLVLPADATGLDSSVATGPPNQTPAGLHDTSAQLPSSHSLSPVANALARPLPVEDANGGQVVDRASPSRPTERRSDSADSRRLPITPIGYGIIGAGVILVLERIRRAQQRQHPRGVRIKLPEGDLADLERGLRVGAQNPLLSCIDLCLRCLARPTTDGACLASSVVAVRCRPEVLELIMDPSITAAAAPQPFRTTAHSNVWALDREWLAGLDADQQRMLSRVDAPIPSLVTLGSDDGGAVLVDVERLGSLAVMGRDADMILQGMVVELSTAPWADGADVVVAGHSGQLRGLERARTVPSLASLVSELRQRIASQDALLSNGHVARAAEGRSRYGGAGWDPMVIVCLPVSVEAEPVAAARLLELAGDGRQGVVALVGSQKTSFPARWSAKTDGGAITLAGPLDPSSERTLADLELAPQLAPSELLHGVDCLLDAADSDSGVAVPAPLALTSPQTRRLSARNADDESYEIDVRVLGPVEVAGNARPFSRAWALELVVYLALHEGGASTDQWATALWPERLMAPASLHSTASSARRSLGVSASGTDHLPRAHGRLILGPGVTSDWARFQRLAASDAPGDRVAALELIRGRPFHGLRGADWTVLEGIVAWMETAVVDLAMRHAEGCLEARDAPGAEWAARQALRVSQYDERLYRILLRSADVAGHPEGVEAAMRELVQLVADDVEPYDSVHPETLELYRRLSRRTGVSHGS